LIENESCLTDVYGQTDISTSIPLDNETVYRQPTNNQTEGTYTNKMKYFLCQEVNKGGKLEAKKGEYKEKARWKKQILDKHK